MIKTRGQKQITDTAANLEQVEQYCAGKEKLLDLFAERLMKASKSKTNPTKVNVLLKKTAQRRMIRGTTRGSMAGLRCRGSPLRIGLGIYSLADSRRQPLLVWVKVALPVPSNFSSRNRFSSPSCVANSLRSAS
ncbi:MAG TPA: hypothetical protein ENJ05_06205 [Thiotrichales bacterium]|nr:hypothetical protein [Thiotrichales bacterium]